MGYALCQARFARDNGLPEDVTVNTFHFITPNPGSVTPAEATSIMAKVRGFYESTWAPNAQPLRMYMSSVLANTGHEVRVYDMEQPKPRAPIASQIFAMTPSASFLPSELAVCLSYRGPLVSGQIPARRRGRIYFGPLDSGWSATADANDVRPEAGRRGALVQAAVSSLMEDTSLGDWAVASQPVPGGIITLTPITHVWCDNAFDVQRRRGAIASSRVTGGGA